MRGSTLTPRNLKKALENQLGKGKVYLCYVIKVLQAQVIGIVRIPGLHIVTENNYNRIGQTEKRIGFSDNYYCIISHKDKFGTHRNRENNRRKWDYRLIRIP